MAETRAVGGNAGHENVSLQSVSARARGRFDLLARSAAFHIVCEIKHGVEVLGSGHGSDTIEICAVCLNITDLWTQVVMVVPVQYRNLVAALHETTDYLATHELGAADHQNPRADDRCALPFAFHSLSINVSGTYRAYAVGFCGGASYVTATGERSKSEWSSLLRRRDRQFSGIVWQT